MLRRISSHASVKKFYYLIKPLLPRRFQVFLRRYVVKRKRNIYSSVWPINTQYGVAPDGWTGWPEKKDFALVLTHDVEDTRGYKKVNKLVELEKDRGFKSAFYFVPKKYKVSGELRSFLAGNGFETGVHGLYHDGKLYNNLNLYKRRAKIINQYIKKWDAVGFRAPAMHHNLSWNCFLNIEYDLSTFDTDPFEPQSDGIGTIFPQMFRDCALSKNCDLEGGGYVEIPYTLPQDFTMFILLQEQGIDIWKQKVDWVVAKGGMVLLDTHPDYMNFGDVPMKIDEYPVDYYIQFLDYLKENYTDRYWHVLPKEMAHYWKKNHSKS